MEKGKLKRTLPLLPLRGLLVFPHMVLHFDVGRDKSIGALEEAMVGDEKIVLAAQKDARVDFPMPEDIYGTGTVAKIKQLLKMPGDTIRVLVEGLHRAKIKEYIQYEPFFKVKIEEIVEDDVGAGPEEEALMRGVMSLFENYVNLNRKITPDALVSIGNLRQPGRFADAIASYLNLKIEDKQLILETLDIKDRLSFLFEILTREIEILELEKRINNRVKKQLEKSQKEYYLREQIKAIQQELGEQDERVAEANEYRNKIKALNLPQDLEEKMMKEVDRLERTPPASAEMAVIRNYLDWIVALPWNTATEDILDIKSAQEILDEGHYGLEKVKERILEFLAVRKLAGTTKAPILCLAGPPGVGKTSLARSIAKAMGRKFVRVSLGGVRDEAEIRGHRRTYVGALPGRIIQGMKHAGTKNPVFLLDEVDKMSVDFRGDPAAALLEVLDPEQNHSFSDHYIELPFDLSKVLFITTANALYNIPRPLLDRMEVISIPGYTEYEKLQIAKLHLIPRQISEHGLKPENLVILDEAIIKIIRNFTREAGVRNLEREIASICRKVAKSVVEGEKTTVEVDGAMVEKFLGAPRFHYGVIEETDQVGVATGLAWTEMGGDILNIEATVMKGKGKLILTGKLGDVMQESAHAGYTYVRSKAEELGIEEDFHEKYDVHIHVPEGAIPKDGPSAGITMACALISALSGRPVDRTVAMTGEITLRGRVLPVGGIKEKVLAAHRAGIKTILLPEENIKDLEEVPQNVKEELCFIFVRTMDEVIGKAIKPLPEKGIPQVQEHVDDMNNLFTAQ
ncbi:endopeptidase La [Thermosediminibacter litoriperuensis]|uniref:Lon protease n=1 Tax=Thermosediminibacter litoriperuensis TaxID=291989 RepID=A0A5S5AL63_9FIRM|nr:endopeptidase La [Thermosediminibacter litoriperuensis]TYP51314.1 ATP-dependent proteinase Serine peptidase MEROPS family S16 [Thermosediminibacter litoriperuensis]